MGARVHVELGNVQKLVSEFWPAYYMGHFT